MTGKRLSDYQRQILIKLLQIQKLSNHEIAWVLEVDERTIRRRRYQFLETGKLADTPDVSKNAEKLKAENLEKLQQWLQDGHEDALLGDMQAFLKEECGLDVSIPTISRQLKKASGTHRKNGRFKRMRAKKLREAADGQMPSSGDHESEDAADDDDADVDPMGPE
ncbi:hypothetical protein B0T19DRAFT_41766 [Cercophora scortea]|uniref:Uncharacterized protein n=1 Tax=Cercophora scortea TaxID=314031 RepID=A0AAE0ML55_9PEZI|nr:hypothetical protein B0T19DRAFT_41766 [Cercophora scortea]